MPADPLELARRIAASTESDTVRGLIVNAALNTLRDCCGEAAVQRARDQTGLQQVIDFFSYKISDYLRLAWITVEAIEPKTGSVEKAFFRLGYDACAGFLATAVGKTLVTMVGSEPRRVLANSPTAYRTTVSYGERNVVWLAETKCQITFERDFLRPEFHEGVYTAAVEGFGGKNVRAHGKALNLLNAVYTVEWDA